MKPHHEHEFEAAPGLPEPLPAGERILWQGSPDWRLLGNDAFHLKRLSVYFAIMLGLQALLSWEPALGVSANLMALVTSAVLASVALGLLALTAWLSARTTLYTLTDRRIVMRIGIVLTLTFNLPLSHIRAAQIKPAAGVMGDIALELDGPDRIAYLHLWPHARPWELNRPQPMLRALADVAAVGSLLHTAWQQAPARTEHSERSTGAATSPGRLRAVRAGPALNA